MKFVFVAGLAVSTSLLAIDNDSAKRLGEASSVFSEVMAAPDKGIPQELLEKAHCIVIVPGLKTAAFVVGGKYGKGYLSCRNKGGSGWSAPKVNLLASSLSAPRSDMTSMIRSVEEPPI